MLHFCTCDSTEEGLYYGVNLREDNFLMLRARLSGKNEQITDLERQEVPIPDEVISGSTKVLKGLPNFASIDHYIMFCVSIDYYVTITSNYVLM